MTEPRPHAAPSLARRIGSALVAYVLLPLALLVAMEAVARVAAPDSVRRRSVSGQLLTPTPGGPVPYVNTPNYRGVVWGGEVELDETGSRFAMDLPSGVCDTTVASTLLFGDSVGFGVGLDQDDATASQLMQASGCTSYLNASVIGYATGHQRAQLEAYPEPALHEVGSVVVLYCLNDPLPKEQVMIAGMPGGPTPDPFSRAGISVWALEHSTLYVWLRSIFGAEATYRRTFQQAFLPLYEGETWAQNQRDLAAIAAWGRHHKTPVLLAVFPHRAQLLPNPESRRPQVLLAETAAAQGLAFVDFAPVLTSDDFLAADGHHLNADGMRKAMVLLADSLYAVTSRPLQIP